MSTVVEAHRPGLRSMIILIGCEAKMVARDTAGLIVPLGLPLLILLTSGLSADRREITGGMTSLELFVLPLVLVMVTATIGIINMPSFLAYYRRSGILRRLAVTPASPFMVLAAQTVVSLLQAVMGIALALTVAVLGFGAKHPADAGAAVGILALTMAAMYGSGIIVAAISPTPNSSVAIGLVIFFVLGALGGMFGNPGNLPEPLATLGGWMPFGSAVEALSAAWSGAAVEWAQLLSLGATFIVGMTVAALLFRWE